MYRLLPALAFFSGVSGIAYELLYMRILSSYLGNVYYVGASILTVFFVGIALGAYFSPRFTKYLKYIELCIGVYAICIVLLISALGLSLSTFMFSLPFGDVLNLVLSVTILLSVPAFLIGFTTPLFSSYIAKYYPNREGFTLTYMLYNLGAGLSVLFVEYVFIRTVGISASVLLFAGINILIALLLFWVRPLKNLRPTFLQTHVLVDSRILFLVSVLSGIAQLATFSVLERVIGPLNENFALILATMLVSISVGTYAVARFRFQFSTLLIMLALTITVPLILLQTSVEFYSYLFGLSGQSYLAIVLARGMFVALFLFPIFVLFGATVPTLVQKYSIEQSNVFLGTAALGNAVGFLLYIFFLYERVSIPILFALTAVTIGCVYLYMSDKLSVQRGLVLAQVMLLSGIALYTWPSYVGAVPYTQITDIEARNGFSRHTTEVMQFKKYSNDVTIVTDPLTKSERLLFNGYQSLIIKEGSNTRLSEVMVGSVGAHLSAEHKSALVFGLGTGLTAGAVSEIYDSVLVAEIHPAMLSVANHFSTLNDGVVDKSNVRIVIQDGVVTLLSSDETYDLILNTVPSPSYFSANKLWTEDVFIEVSKKLNVGGVFVGWMDARLGVQGIQIMLNTLNGVFADCVYVFLNTGYYAFVCSNETIEYQIDTPQNMLLQDTLRERLSNLTAEQAVRTSFFRIPQHSVDTTLRNTLDKPLLEFIYEPDRMESNNQMSDTFEHALSRDAFTDALKDSELVNQWLDLVLFRNR